MDDSWDRLDRFDTRSKVEQYPSVPPPPPPSREELDRLKPIFDLFTPYAAAKARERFPTTESRVQFVHYTSAEAALRSYIIAADNRLTVAEPYLPEWVPKEGGVSDVFCLPLMWARQIDPPVGHELEAWYVWARSEPTHDWRLSAASLLAGDPTSPEAKYQIGEIHPATIEESDRKYRLSCAGLLSSLRERGHTRVWVMRDAPSFSFWTDYAYQAWHGKLTR